MFSSVFSSLGKLIWNDPEDNSIFESRSLVQIPSGTLLLKSNGSFSQVFEFADVTLVKDIEPFTYFIIFRRLFDEGEEDNLSSSEKEDPSTFELKFPLKTNMNFTRASDLKETLSRISFQWLDPLSKKLYLFIPDESVSAHTLQLFHLTMAQSLYETKHKEDYSKAEPTEIEAIMEGANRKAIPKDGILVYETLSTSDIYLYLFDISSGLFISATGNSDDLPPAVIASVYMTESFKYDIIVHSKVDPNQIYYSQNISPSDIVHIERASCSFVWCHLSEIDGSSLTYSLKFSIESELFSFSNNYAKCIYEILNSEKASVIDKKDESFLFGQAVPMDIDEEEEEESETSESESESDEEGESLMSDSTQKESSSDKNNILALGYKSNRTFVSRGSSIGVFKYTNDNKLAFETTIKAVKTPTDKKLFSPTKLMLHDNDSSLVLMKPGDQHSLFKMDLERGEVVEEWKIDEYAPIHNIVPDSKYAQMTPCQTMIGMNHNSIFRIDPRLSGSKRVETETKQYVVKNEFSCGATTASGELAVASKKGDIRLFNKLDKRAKTLLPGFGDPILGIDTTDDGKAILATCKNYILLINADSGDGKHTGFTKSLGSDKPVPIRLQLKPEHVAYMGGKSISFTEAHFSTGEAADRSIIASTGPYVITWTIKSIRAGKLYDYSIRKYSDTVVADNFKYGQDKNIIVTLPDQVAMISKSSLLSPKKLNSIHGIVDSPF